MEEIVLFFMSFLFIFIIYQFFIIGPLRKKSNNKVNKKDKELLEIKYLTTKYKLDLKKIEYNQLLQICGIVSSFDISLTVSLIFLSDNLLLELLIGFISISVLIIISYHFVYLFYKKKGMIIDGKCK